MLYLAIPAHNEVATIGVLLWRLRTVLAEFPREYEVVVYDDASTDETAAVAEQYVHAMPVTVLRGATPVGYAGAVNALVRHVAAHTRYPRRDAMLLLQGDFTDPPGIVPEFARRFEGGADLVVGERTAVVDAPVPVRRLFSAAGWALRPFVKVEGIRDLTGSMRLMRIQALRDLLRTVGDESVCAGDSWTANADLLLRLVPHARRVESVPVEPTYGVRTRDTRRATMRDALAALRWGWRARGRKAVPTSAPDAGADTTSRTARSSNPSRRRDEPELTADRLRERTRDRDRLRGEQDNSRTRRDARPEREGRDATRAAQVAEQKADRRDRKREEKANGKRGEKRSEERSQDRTQERNNKRDKRDASGEEKLSQPREARANEPRAPRPPRPEQQRRDRKQPLSADAELMLDDPFAGPSSRSQANAMAAQSPAPAETPERGDEHLATPAPSASRSETSDTSGDLRGVSSDIGTDARENDRDDDTDEVSDEQGDADESVDASSAARERKRRRNRRSRRRRSKHRADGAEAGGEDPATDDAGSTTGSHDAESRDTDSIARKDVGRDDSHREYESDDDNSSDDASADASDEGDGKDHVARARRRGRRGRRGGSRRSRTRGRERGESDGPSGESPSAPPPGDAE